MKRKTTAEKALELACGKIADQADEMGYNDCCPAFNRAICRYECYKCKGNKLKEYFMQKARTG